MAIKTADVAAGAASAADKGIVEQITDTAKHLWSFQEFRLTLFTLAAFVFAFFPFFTHVGKLWGDMDSYYAHGPLVPLLAAFLIYEKWDKMKGTPVKAFWPALLPVVALVGLYSVSSHLDQPMIQSLTFLAALWFAVWFVAGGRWVLHLTLPIGFLAFGLPMLDRFIDSSTLQFQMWSTDIAYWMLGAVGLQPFRSDPVIIHLPNWQLYVAAACSGLKTTIAVCSAVALFILMGRLKFYGNMILAAVAMPLSIVINGIRIAMIGMVGNEWGENAGMKFHDYSGYIALLLCFTALFFIAKWLEPKDPQPRMQMAGGPKTVDVADLTADTKDTKKEDVN
jgi:exosortase